MDISKLKEFVLKQDYVKKFIISLFGVFLLALNYNLFFLPNNFVVGGTSGLSIVFKDLLGWNPQVFMYASTIILIIVSLLLLGIKQTSASVLGSVMYPIFVTLTTPLAEFLQPYFVFDNILLLILITGGLYGFAYGIIYKVGFDTGGSDIVVRIVTKYFHVSEGQSSIIVQGIVVLIGGIVFGLNQMIYALLILFIYTTVMDKIIIGISDSKMFFVHTKEPEKVKEFIINVLKAGVTILETEGGYSKNHSNILMCVVPNKDYYLFKETVLNLDPHAFLIINDCYEVKGGVKRRNLPFL